KDLGLGFPAINPYTPMNHADITVQMVKDDAPIVGQVKDLQGRPVVGAKATVYEFWFSMKGDDLTKFLATLKQKRELYTAMNEHQFGQTGIWMGRDIGRILPPAVTGADGKFRLTGVGRERIVALRIEGPTIATTELWAMTRAGETLRVSTFQAGRGEVTFRGAKVEHLSVPGRPIVGPI